jgi:hypothetical protein
MAGLGGQHTPKGPRLSSARVPLGRPMALLGIREASAWLVLGRTLCVPMACRSAVRVARSPAHRPVFA